MCWMARRTVSAWLYDGGGKRIYGGGDVVIDAFGDVVSGGEEASQPFIVWGRPKSAYVLESAVHDVALAGREKESICACCKSRFQTQCVTETRGGGQSESLASLYTRKRLSLSLTETRIMRRACTGAPVHIVRTVRLICKGDECRPCCWARPPSRSAGTAADRFASGTRVLIIQLTKRGIPTGSLPKFTR